MKKFFLISGIVLGTLLLLLFTLPFLFKDKIKKAVDEQIANNVNATVFYNADKFGLTFFKKFPALTVTLGEFGVVGFAPFEGDTLVSMNEFNVSVDVLSVVFGKQIKIKSILLDNPSINVIVLKTGEANYNISKPSTDTAKVEPTAEPTKFSVGIDKWEIVNGKLIYDDRQSPQYAKIIGLNHVGKGDFTQDIYDLDTKTTIDSLTYALDTVTYLKNHKFDAKLVLNIDNSNSKYTFKDNLFKINDFGLGVDGSVQMNKDSSMTLDIKLKTPETTFSSILSLIPAVYKKDFTSLKTEGSFAFDAFAKGNYKGSQYPGFGLNLNIKDGFVQYPSLPSAIKNISLDLNIDNQSGNLDSLVVNLKQMHVEVGSNPFDAKFYLKGLNKKYFEANLKGVMNLAELTQLYPMQGYTLKGIFDIDASAKGYYDATSNKMPYIIAHMGLKDGYVKTEAVPAPLEQINMTASVENNAGTMKDMKAKMSSFRMVFDGEPFEAHAEVEDFTDYTYAAFVKGKLDMEKLTKLYPLEGMTIKGFIDTEIDTKGKMSLISAQKYDQLQTSGKMDFTNFSFKSTSFPQGIVMNKAQMIFDPKQIRVPLLKGSLGKSEIDMTGTFNNYMAYVFKNETIVGKMTFNSPDFDVNEWMGGEDTTAKANQPTQPQPVAAIPKNLDITMDCKLKKVLYSTYDMYNMSGIVTMKDGVFALDKGFFNMIEADFKTNMTYDTKDMKHPGYSFDLDVKNLEIKKAYDKFEIVKKLASIAKDVDGKLATNFKVKGELGNDYAIIYPTMNGSGQIFIADAHVKNISYINEAKKLTKLDIPEEYSLQNTKIDAEIINGRVFFKPFDVKAGNIKLNIGGSQGFDQTVDYIVKTSVPASGVNKLASSALSSIFGKALPEVKSYRVDMNVKGNSKSPKVSILSIVPEGAGGTDATKQATDQLKKQAEEKLRAEADRVAKEAAKKGAEEAARKALEQAKKKLPNIKFP